jgi:hypothetical protein
MNHLLFLNDGFHLRACSPTASEVSSKTSDKYTSFLCFAIPSKHRVNSFREFRAVGLVDTAGSYPGVLQAVEFCSVLTKQDFVPTSSVFSFAIAYVLIGNLLVVQSPSMRENGVGRRRISANKFDEARLAVNVEMQKAHDE